MGGFRTFAGARSGGKVAPIPAIRVATIGRLKATLSSRSPTLVRLTRHASEAAIPVEPI